MSFKAFFLSLTIVAIMFFSAFGTTKVYADDGTTDTTGSTDTVTVSPATGGGVTIAVTPKPGGDSQKKNPRGGTTGGSSNSGGGVVFGGRPVVDKEPPAPIADVIPDDTTITVIDSNGDVVPLGTQVSADIIASNYDPIWCPDTQSPPTPGENGCTQLFDTFDDLLAFLQANENDPAYQQAGTIYIQEGAYNGPETSIDLTNFNFTSFNNYDLTFQGGWDTTTNTINTDGSTDFVVPIIIGSDTNPWAGSITINNIGITDVGGDTGLTVYSAGDITVSDVSVTYSDIGADLNADGNVTVQDSNFSNNQNGGAVINAGGTVDISNSQFNNNRTRFTNGGGLDVTSGSDVSLVGVTANENGLFGANISADGTVSVDLSVFSGNVAYTYSCKGSTATGGYGIQTVTTGDIYFDGVVANDNFSFGASLQGDNVEVYNGVYSNNGANSGFFNNLTGQGLEIVSTGYVILDNVQVNNNKDFGLNIQAGDFVVVSNTEANQNNSYGAHITSSKDVTINDSYFDGNASYTYSCKGITYKGYGLQVVAVDNIYITNVSASGNNLFGANLDGSAVYIFGGFFNNNGSDAGNTGYGVKINSDTNVSITNLVATDNQLFGANIAAVNDVTISSGIFNGNKAYAYSCKGQTAIGGYGLQIVTGGQITLSSIYASDNYQYGAHLEGASVALVSGVFDNNGSGSLTNPVGKGLEITTTGSVDLVSVEANNNQLFGANIQAGGNVSITDGFFNGNTGYTYSCKGKTYTGYGLQVVSGGTISMINIEANNNYLYGAHLEGQNIFISYGSFDNNGTGNPADKVGSGLEIVSTGANSTVSLYQVTANNNQLFGANIQAEGFVSVSDSVFSGNVNYTSGSCSGTTYGGYGLQVVTTGGVNLFNVTANDNGTYGASLTGNLVEVYNSTFDNNITSDGLTINATQAILDNVTASGNGANGVKICANDVTVTNSVFDNNKKYGLNVGSPAFTESGNTYTNNGSGGLFQSTTCTTNTGNGQGGGWGWGWGWGFGV